MANELFKFHKNELENCQQDTYPVEMIRQAVCTLSCAYTMNDWESESEDFQQFLKCLTKQVTKQNDVKLQEKLTADEQETVNMFTSVFWEIHDDLERKNAIFEESDIAKATSEETKYEALPEARSRDNTFPCSQTLFERGQFVMTQHKATREELPALDPCVFRSATSSKLAC